MSIQNMSNANALFLPAWNNATKNEKKTTQTEQEKAMEAFGKALYACDRATENMMDKHHKSVVESAKKRAEHHKRRAVQDRVKESAEASKLFHESIMIQQINYRNMLKGIRIDEQNRDDVLKAEL